jgi:hypothetical protein
MNNYIVHENQTLLDVSAHVYGRVDVVVDLALLNNISVTEVLTAGQIIKLVEAPVNLLAKKSIESRNIIPCTGFGATLDEFVETLGIGTMAIGTTFIVSP